MRSVPAESASRRPLRPTMITRPRSRSAATCVMPGRSRRSPEVDGRGEELRLAARLRADLGIDPVAQAEDQRYLEGDDRQHQHIGERQQQSEPEAYENSSGAVKRKPTPRTVCT